MGVEDWENKYKLDDSLLDDHLDPEQKTWDDDDDDETKSEIYHIVSNPSDSKRSCFYQAVECEAKSPEANEYDKAGNLGSEDVRLVYKEAGSFEDETSPPEIAIIPSVRKLHQQEADQEAYKESLLYKTRMWAKTHIEDILENYAIYRQKEEARMRTRSEYESGEAEFSPGSEEDLDVVAFIEEDTQCEHDSSYNSPKYISSYGERPESYYELRGNVTTQLLDDGSIVLGPSDDYIDTMNELQKIVDTVTEYLAGREEEISKYEEIHKTDKTSNMVEKEKDKDIKSDEEKEETPVEQSITGVKTAMNSLFSTTVGTNSTGETTDTTAVTSTSTSATTSTCSPLPLQPESGNSKMLSFIPKSNSSPTPVAVVPPAHQELSADKKSLLQSLLPLPSSETSHPTSLEGADDTANGEISPDTQGSTASQSQSVVDSVLGRLSPFRIFGDEPAGEATSQPETPNKSHASAESKEGLTDKAKTLSIEQSATQPEHQSSCGGSCSGSVELLPETESSGEIPDAPSREMTLKPDEQKTAEDTGFFSPFKRSLTSFMTTTPGTVNKTESPSGNSVFSIFKPAEAPKPEDAPATIGDKLKLSFFSSDTPATPQAPKQESGLLSGLLKLGPGEDATTSKQEVSNTSTKSPLLSRAILLESVPKGNTDTGWFSNLFKMSPAESPKPQTLAKPTSKPAATIKIPTVVVAVETDEDSSTLSKDVAQEEQMAQEDATSKSETDLPPESLTDAKNAGQCVITPETQADPSELQDQAQPEEEAMSEPQGLVSDGNKTSDKPQEGGLLSTLFSSLTGTTNENKAQQVSVHQSKGLFSGILKMAATENAGIGNEPAGVQQQPVKSESHLGSASPAGGQKQSQEQKATSPKGFLAGLFSKGSEEDSSSKLIDANAAHVNDENNSSVGKDLLSGILKPEANESSRTTISKDSASTDPAALSQGGGLLSGLFKFASDTVSGSSATPAQQISQPLLTPETPQGSDQPPPQTATPPSHPGGVLSGLFKLPAGKNECGPGNVVPDQQPEQPGNRGGQQPNHKQPNTQSNAPSVQPQSGGLFGGILKLTESALSLSSPQQPSGTSSHPNQQSAEPSPMGEIVSGFLNKTSVAESTPQQSRLPAASQDPTSPQQSASAEKGSFLSGLFGISTSEANTSDQVCPQDVNSQQINRPNLVPHQEAQPSGRAGILSGLFNKIVDTSSQSVQLDTNQNTAQQSSPGLLSGLFSTNWPPAQQQKSPLGAQMKQQQQANRQPLQRQHQIPVQPAAPPEPQQRGLFSGLFNKLTSTDTPTQHPVAENSPSQQACRSEHPAQDHRSPPATHGLTEVFKTSTVTTAPKKFSPEQQEASTGLHQQPNRRDQQVPNAPPSPGAAKPQSQPGGLLSSIFKMSASEELQQEQTQSNTQTAVKSEAQDCDAQENGVLSGFFSKLSAKPEDKSDSHIPSGQKPQQHEERKPIHNRPQIQRAKPIEQESTQEGGNEKDQRAPLQKGFLAGLFSKGSEDNTLSKLNETNETKPTFAAGKGMASGGFKSESSEISKAAITKESEKGFTDQRLHKHIKEEVSSVTSISGSKTSARIQEPVTLHPAIKSTQQYLEEVHRLLYGTASEYGYQDLLYLFADHGIVPPELYEHQCLIEAILWQQLNDYAMLEALEAQAQECYAGPQEVASSSSHETAMQEPLWWNLKNMDSRQFYIPSYPWQNAVSSSFQKRLPQADAEDEVVFDMSVKSRKLWASCDDMDHCSNQTSRNHWIEKDSTGTPAKLTRCKSLFDCSIFGRPVQNGTLGPQFNTSKFIKRLAVKKGPIDLTAGAVDLSSFSATTRDTEDDMFFEDSEWYQQWLSLLEQGMWWPAEAGDCGYYIHADEEYIYSLLTDRSGKHLYAYTTQENRHGLEEIAENISNTLQNKDEPKTTLCGFKIPVFNEDEIPWTPCHSQRGVLSSPVDLSSAFEKGDRIMNMNLECFSEMLQDSIIAQTQHPVDLSVYKLQKINVGKDENKKIPPREQMEATDLTNKITKVNNGGPYWKNQGINDLFPGQMVTGVSANISSQTTSVTYRQHSSIRCHPPTPEVNVRVGEETNKKVLLNDYGAKAKDVESSKIGVMSNTADSNLQGSKIIPQNQRAQRKLPDAPVSYKASTNSAKSHPATLKKIVTEPSIVTPTSSQMTPFSPQRSTSCVPSSSGLPSSAVSHRPQLGRQSSVSTQSLKTSRTEGDQSSACPILPQPPKIATFSEKRALPPPQNLLYNRPKQALDSLLRSKPLDFSGSLRNNVKYPGKHTTCALPDLSNDDIIIGDIIDFTKKKLKKVRKNHQCTCQSDTIQDVGIDLIVEIKEEGQEINMTFPALERTKSFPVTPEVPLRTVSAPPSPPVSGASHSVYRTDQHSSLSPSIGSKLVRQVSVQCSYVSTTPEINTSPKLCTNFPGSKADCGKEQKATGQGTSAAQPTSPEIQKYSTLNPRSQFAQNVHQPSVKIIPAPPQPCCKSTSPANLVTNILDMSSAPMVTPLDKSTAETQIVALVRSRRTSVADIGDGSLGVPLIVDPSTVQVKQIQSQKETMTAEVWPLHSTTKTSQVSPVLCRQQPVYHMDRDLSAHFSQSCQNVSAPANSIKTTLDMRSKPAEETAVSSDEAVSLVRRRSTTGIIEEFGGVCLVVEPLATKVKPPLRRYQSQDTITKPTQRIVNMTSQIKSVTQHQTTLYRMATHGTVRTSANPLKATLDISPNSVSKTSEGTVTSHGEMLPVVGKVMEETVGSSIIQHPTPEIKPLLRKCQSVEKISQNSSQDTRENKRLSALTTASMVKASLDMSRKPAGNTSSSEHMLLVKNQPLFDITGPALGMALSLDRSSKDLSQTKHSGMVKLIKTNSNTDIQALQMFDGVPSTVSTSAQPKKRDTLLHIELNKNQWQKQALFGQTLPGTPSLVLRSRSPSAQLANIPSAPANLIKHTLDMSLLTAIKEPDTAGGRILETSPGKVMALVQTKNVISKKDWVGMPLIVKAISAPEQLSEKELQAEKVLNNGPCTAETPLCVQTSTYHSDRLFYSSLKPNKELQAQSKPMDFSFRVSHSQCDDQSSMQDGQLMDFTTPKEVTLRTKQTHQQRLRTTNQQNHTPVMDLTVAHDANTQTSGIKDLSMQTNSFLPCQYPLTSLAMDRICTTPQYNLQALGAKEQYITQSQDTCPTVQPATSITSTKSRTTTEHLENHFNMPGIQTLTKPQSVLSVEQKKSTESSFSQTQLTDKNLYFGKRVISNGPPIFRPVTNSLEVLRVEQSTPFKFQNQHISPTQTQGSRTIRHTLITSKFMQHESPVTQVAGSNRLLEVSRSKTLFKQSTVESQRENTIQSWVPTLNSPTYIPEIPQVLNTSKASVHTSVVSFASGQKVSSVTCHEQEFSNLSNIFTASSTDITPCTVDKAAGQGMSQVSAISEDSLAHLGSTYNGSYAEPKRKPLLATNIAPKAQISSRQTLFETENTTKSLKDLILKFDGPTSIAGEDTCTSLPDQQMSPLLTHPITSAKVEPVTRLVSMTMEGTSPPTPESLVQSSMENHPAVVISNLACTEKPFETACTVITMASPCYTAPPTLGFLPAVPYYSNAAHISEPTVTYCPDKNLSGPLCVASSASVFSPSSPLPSPGYPAPPPMEFPPAVPFRNAAHTAEPSVTYTPVKTLSSPGCCATTATASLFGSTVFTTSPVLQNIACTAPPPTVFSNDKQCTSPTTGSVLHGPNSLSLQSKNSVSQLSNKVSNAPTIIITEVDVESQEPSSVMLAQPEIPERVADLMVSKTACEPSLMISDTSTNAMWNKTNSVVVTVNNIDVTSMPQQFIQSDDHRETCSPSSPSQEVVHATGLASKQDMSESKHTDSDIFSQEQSTVGAISSEMLFDEEVPCFVAISPTDIKKSALRFTRLHSRQMLIPYITLKHPEQGCSSDEETMSLHGTRDDACESVTEANEDTNQQSILFETSEAVVSAPEELTSHTDLNQASSSAIIVPVASTEVSESTINFSANSLTSSTPKISNTKEQVCDSLLVQDNSLRKKELPSVGKDESKVTNPGNVLVCQNKDISFEHTHLIVDITSSELVKSPEEVKEKAEDQKLRPETSEKAKPTNEEDSEVSPVSMKEPLSHIGEHLPSESTPRENQKGFSDSSETPDMSNEQEGVQARLNRSSSLEAQVLNTDVISTENTLPPTTVPEEQSGKVIFSLFGGSSCASSQTQSGSSVLSGLLPGASTSKETPGTSLFSMFGGASHQQTQASSEPKEGPGKKLFSMFSGSTVQQPLGSSGPSGLSPQVPPGFDSREKLMSRPLGASGHDLRGGPISGLRSPPGPRGSSHVGLPPRIEQPKESAGKGLFSIFNSPLNQQSLASGAPPRPSASRAPNLKGDLPETSTHKDNTGSGLFSIFGGSTAQAFPTQTVNKCSNKESVGKGLFSRFGGTEPSESESLFKVPSVFSLGGGSDKQRLSGFGLLSFMDDKKSAEPTPEDKAATKLEDAARESFSMNGDIKYVKSSHAKPKESEQDLPNNSASIANESHEKINTGSTETEIKSAHAVLNPEDGKIPEDKTTATSDAQIIEELETEIKTLEHPTEEEQQYLETEKNDKSDQFFQSQETDAISEDKTLATFECIDAQITEKSETEIKTLDLQTEGEPQKQESLETEKPLDSEQNHRKEQESDTREEAGTLPYTVEPPQAETSENSLESEKPVESDEITETQIPQELNKPEDYVSHTETGETPVTLDESHTRELLDIKVHTKSDEIPEKVEKSWDREVTQNLYESEKARSKTDEEADCEEQPKNDPCDGAIEKELAQVKEQEAAEKQFPDTPAQRVSEPLSAVIIAPQPQSLPETMGALDKPKPRMVEPPGCLRLEMQGHHKPNMTSFPRPPESGAFSGFMSMFSGPSAPSKPAASSFFTSPQHSFFKLQPTGATCAPQQHKTSFFNLPTNLPAGLSTESLKGDLFGLLKTKDAARPEETKSAVETCKLKTEDYVGTKNFNEPRSFTDKESSTAREPGEVASEQDVVNDCDRSDIVPVEEARDGNKVMVDMSIKGKESEAGVMKEDSSIALKSPLPIDRVVSQEKDPSSPTAKSMFDLTGLSAPPFGGLLSGAADTAKPFSSLFGSSTDKKLTQQPPDSGSLFTSLKGFSAGLFQEEKSALPKDEAIAAPSVFGKKSGFPWQSPAPSQTPSTVVTTQVENKNDNENEPDIEILSLESDITESPDSSDTEGPSDTCSHKQQSFDSSPESLLAVKPDTSKPGEEKEAEANPSLNEKDMDATDHLVKQLPESLLRKEHGRRLVGT